MKSMSFQSLPIVCVLLTSCFTLSISDPSGKSQPVPDGVRNVLLPVTIAADVVTSPIQIAAVGGYVAASSASRAVKKASVPTIRRSDQDNNQ